MEIYIQSNLMLVLENEYRLLERARRQIMWLQNEISAWEPGLPEVSIRGVYRDTWEKPESYYYKAAKKESVSVWKR